jgi:hypothetical protein
LRAAIASIFLRENIGVERLRQNTNTTESRDRLLYATEASTDPRIEVKVMEIFPVTDSFIYLVVKLGALILVLLLWLALSRTPAV